MPKLNIAGVGEVEVEKGVRLINALCDHLDIGHRCGGKAACTTCRVKISAGEPEKMTAAERKRLERVEMFGEVRLSCQILVEEDMDVEVQVRLSDVDWPDAGPTPADEIEPPPEWNGYHRS